MFGASNGHAALYFRVYCLDWHLAREYAFKCIKASQTLVTLVLQFELFQNKNKLKMFKNN
ncbi:hypothetical protein BpHYR1_014207 [Brachionus plicatilis]|uniref:Uncharacterized protein n=1 Tax=Brachionus plicatilis TaxID=10195 RepID=A0A3M7S9D2_BRAPC|nr:hypothetical protein BpHYR1_014207 [Brachionus plicatilis]